MACSLFLFSCEQKKRAKAQQKQQSVKPLTYEQKLKIHHDSLKTFSDTVFLGFILRSGKSQVQEHIKALIKEKKTKNLVSYKVSLLGSSVIVGGYPYNMYFEGKEMETVFKPFYEDGKLFQIEIAMVNGGDSDYVIRAMNKKYGPGKTITQEYNTTHKWINHNTEIEVGSGSLFTISYTDFAKKMEIDSISSKRKSDKLKTGSKETNDAL